MGVTAEERQRLLADAIRDAYRAAEITQDELAARVGETLDRPVNQGMVSRWVRGEVVPELETIVAIEDAVGMSRGAILKASGYVADPVDITSVADGDPPRSPARTALVAPARRATGPAH